MQPDISSRQILAAILDGGPLRELNRQLSHFRLKTYASKGSGQFLNHPRCRQVPGIIELPIQPSQGMLDRADSKPIRGR